MNKFLRRLILLLCLFVACFFLWREIYLARDPNSTETKIFLVEKGEGSKQIALNLEREGLIKWDLLFRLYVLTKGISGNLQAGAYELSPSMAVSQIAGKFASGDTLKIKITIPEGFNLGQIEQEVSSKLQREFSLDDFGADDFKEEFDFLEDAPDAASLEGFLFPDTYFFKPDEEDREICLRFLGNFKNKIALYETEISAFGKKMFEVITMASLIEKEVRTLEDKKLVSGILWKRLENKVPLQVDATVAYITGKQTVRISIEETKIDSPYNTYKYRGLPVGPISNPGLESIMAAISPKMSNNWYYLSTPEGETIFSETLEKHNAARAEYLK